MKPRFIITGAVLVFVAIIGLTTLFGSWYSVDQGETVVVLRNGAIAGESGPGLHFKTPWIESIVYVTLQSHTRPFDKMESYSKDQQPAIIQLSVNWHVPPDKAQALYAEYGSVDNMLGRVLDQKVPAIFKNVFGTYDAQTAIQQRTKLNADFLLAMQEGITNAPITIEGVQIVDIKFSPDYEAAIAAKQKATVQVQEQQQVLDQEIIKAKITVTQATAQADSQLAIATNQAKAVQINGEAQAAAIKARGDAEAGVIKAKAEALASNALLIEQTKAERWDGKLPTTVLPNGTLPFFNTSSVAQSP